MSNEWLAKNTTTQQDHVIAHVVGANVLGYFVFDEALYVLLDIGFLWTIFVDGEMTLLPHPVAVNELEIDDSARAQIKADIDLLLNDNLSSRNLTRLLAPPVECRIEDVSFCADADRRRLILKGETGSLAVETSLTTAEIQVYELQAKTK